MKYFLGTIVGLLIGFILGFIVTKIRSNNKSDNVQIHIGSYLRRIGELHVYRAYMKEIVTSVDHVWGDVGKKYFSWIISHQKLAMVFEFEVDFIYDLTSSEFQVTSSKAGYDVAMPKCIYDVKIKDFYFYDEQGTRLKILPEILSTLLSGGVSEEKKNELKDMALEQIKSISKEVAESLQPEAHSATKDTIKQMLLGQNVNLKHIRFHETKIIDDQIVLGDSKMIEI